ncbi:MAG TPA: hypothetical protein PKB03_05990 [Baekduia sp.]|nr:hypothetical protein [Baekduia sp.]
MRDRPLSPSLALFYLLLLVALFWAVTGIALLLGAANLGTAMTFGQIAFVFGVAFVLLTRP